MNKIEVNAKLQYAFGGLPLSKAQKTNACGSYL